MCCTHSLAGRGLDIRREEEVRNLNLNPNFQTVNQRTPTCLDSFPHCLVFICLFQVSVPLSSIILFLLADSVEACISSCPSQLCRGLTLLDSILHVPAPHPQLIFPFAAATPTSTLLSAQISLLSLFLQSSSSQSPNKFSFSPWLTRSLISQGKKKKTKRPKPPLPYLSVPGL